jgi:hypothetical protein
MTVSALPWSTGMLMADETEKWRNVLKFAGIKAA